MAYSIPIQQMLPTLVKDSSGTKAALALVMKMKFNNNQFQVWYVDRLAFIIQLMCFRHV